MFYECLKLGIKNWNSVLNRVGIPTQGYIEYPPPPGSTFTQFFQLTTGTPFSFNAVNALSFKYE